MIYVGSSPASDRETLYYFNAKAIPAEDKAQVQGKNILVIATVTRIKLFIRPPGLKPSVDEAPRRLTFKRQDGQITVTNPTPYYLTLVGLRLGGDKLKSMMVAPFSSATETTDGSDARSIDYHVIDDFGAVTPEFHASISLS